MIWRHKTAPCCWFVLTLGKTRPEYRPRDFFEHRVSVFETPVLSRDVEFEEFVANAGPRLRGALVAAYGSDPGLDAAAEALAYAWEHWDRLSKMENPAGYLYRVGQSCARRTFKEPAILPTPEHCVLPDFEPQLLPALGKLSENQRVVVVLVHGFGWRHVEVAELLCIEPGTVRTHLARGLCRLQEDFEVIST